MIATKFSRIAIIVVTVSCQILMHAGENRSRRDPEMVLAAIIAYTVSSEAAQRPIELKIGYVVPKSNPIMALIRQWVTTDQVSDSVLQDAPAIAQEAIELIQRQSEQGWIGDVGLCIDVHGEPFLLAFPYPPLPDTRDGDEIQVTNFGELYGNIGPFFSTVRPDAMRRGNKRIILPVYSPTADSSSDDGAENDATLRVRGMPLYFSVRSNKAQSYGRLLQHVLRVIVTDKSDDILLFDAGTLASSEAGAGVFHQRAMQQFIEHPGLPMVAGGDYNARYLRFDEEIRLLREVIRQSDVLSGEDQELLTSGAVRSAYNMYTVNRAATPRETFERVEQFVNEIGLATHGLIERWPFGLPQSQE